MIWKNTFLRYSIWNWLGVLGFFVVKATIYRDIFDWGWRLIRTVNYL